MVTKKKEESRGGRAKKPLKENAWLNYKTSEVGVRNVLRYARCTLCFDRGGRGGWLSKTIINDE